MKKFLASISIFCAISSSAQNSGFVLLGDIQGGKAYIGNINPQVLTSDPSVKLAEFTMFYSDTGNFSNFVADCMKPDITFSVRIDTNGNKYRSNPILTPKGTIGWSSNVYACANAYVWPSNSDSKPEPKRQRTIPI